MNRNRIIARRKKKQKKIKRLSMIRRALRKIRLFMRKKIMIIQKRKGYK